MRIGSNTMRAMVCAALAIGAVAVPARASSPPLIESESASSVTQTDATLNATINPHGLYTAYQFQIDTAGTYAFTRPVCPLTEPGYPQREAILVGAPLPAGLVEPPPAGVPAGSGPQAVSIDLAAVGATLQPHTLYHFRVIAAAEGTEVEGPDRTFTTATQVPTRSCSRDAFRAPGASNQGATSC